VCIFVDSDWSLFAKPFELDGVTVAWPKALIKLITEPGPLSSGSISSIGERLSERLRPA
jgi:hypothetical protein